MKEAIPYRPENDAIDWRMALRRARHAIARHVPLILVSCGVALLLVVIYIRIFPPIYKAEAILLAEPNEDVVRANYYAYWDVFRKGDVKSEPELVTSGRVARKVVAALDLKFNDVHHTFLTQIAYFWTDSWIGKKYHAFKEWLFPPDPAAYQATPEEIETARTVDAFKDGVSVEPVPGTTIAKVVVLAPSFRAAAMANRVVDVYLAERKSMFLNEAETAYKSLEAELVRAAADLAAVDRQKFEFDTSNKVVLDFEKDKLLVANWVTLQSSVDELKASIASLEASEQVVEEQLKKEPREVINSTKLQDSQEKTALQAKLIQLRTSLELERERFVPGSPEVAQLEKLVAQTKAAVEQEPEQVAVAEDKILNPVYTELRQKQNNILTQLAAAKATLAAKHIPLVALEKRMEQIPGLARTILEQTRVRDGLEARFKLLRDRAMQADASIAAIGSAPPSVRVIDYASPPMKATWPKNIILIPAALGVGLFMGIMLALLADMFTSTVNRDRLAAHPDIPLYAVIELRDPSPSGLAGATARDSRSVVERLRRVS